MRKFSLPGVGWFGHSVCCTLCGIQCFKCCEDCVMHLFGIWNEKTFVERRQWHHSQSKVTQLRGSRKFFVGRRLEWGGVGFPAPFDLEHGT